MKRMKQMNHCLAAGFIVAILSLSAFVAAQTTQSMSAAPNTTTAAAKPMPSVRKQAVRRPASLMPPPQARPSTAEAGPLRSGWKPLKEMPALQLTGVDGKAAALTPTGMPKHWLLLYRHADCIPCDRLMVALAASTSPELQKGKPYVVLVDSAKPDALETVQASNTGFSGATWMADRNREAFAALKPHGSPVLYAMEGNRIAWNLAGSLDSTATVTHIVDAWLAANAETNSGMASADKKQSASVHSGSTQ